MPPRLIDFCSGVGIDHLIKHLVEAIISDFDVGSKAASLLLNNLGLASAQAPLRLLLHSAGLLRFRSRLLMHC